MMKRCPQHHMVNQIDVVGVQKKERANQHPIYLIKRMKRTLLAIYSSLFSWMSRRHPGVERGGREVQEQSQRVVVICQGISNENLRRNMMSLMIKLTRRIPKKAYLLLDQGIHYHKDLPTRYL